MIGISGCPTTGSVWAGRAVGGSGEAPCAACGGNPAREGGGVEASACANRSADELGERPAPSSCPCSARPGNRGAGIAGASSRRSSVGGVPTCGVPASRPIATAVCGNCVSGRSEMAAGCSSAAPATDSLPAVADPKGRDGGVVAGREYGTGATNRRCGPGIRRLVVPGAGGGMGCGAVSSASIPMRSGRATGCCAVGSGAATGSTGGCAARVSRASHVAGERSLPSGRKRSSARISRGGVAVIGGSGGGADRPDASGVTGGAPSRITPGRSGCDGACRSSGSRGGDTTDSRSGGHPCADSGGGSGVTGTAGRS